MKSSLILFACMLLAFASCTESRPQEKPGPGVPKVLQNDESISMDIVKKGSKRRAANILEGVYAELEERTPELIQLENEIVDLNRSRHDSTNRYRQFWEKNDDYFKEANNYAGEIRDSLLRTRLKDLIAASMARYHSTISRHEDIMKTLDHKKNTLDDLFTALRVIRTLPIMEQYQRESLPDIKSLSGYQQRLDQAIKHADTLTRK
jgi:hypothetical protein